MSYPFLPPQPAAIEPALALTQTIEHRSEKLSDPIHREQIVRVAQAAPDVRQQTVTPRQSLSAVAIPPLLNLSPPETLAPEKSTLPPIGSAASLGEPLEIQLAGAPSPTSNGPIGYSLAQASTSSDPSTPSTPTPAPPTTPPAPLELKADRQDYNAEQQVFTAEGNVEMLFRGAILRADRLQVNLNNRRAIAEGNVSLTRGRQVLQGRRFEYDFVQSVGTIYNAKGELYIPTTGTDFSGDLNTGVASRPVGDRIIANQPPQNVTSPGQVTGTVGAGRDAPPTLFQGDIRRIRYEAERIDFTAEGWQARNIRVTNDPFSPPELELRADQAQLTQTSPTESVLETSQPRIVLDQSTSLPIPRSRAVLGRRQRDSGLLQIGYDGGERGGLFVEQTFEPVSSEQLQISITPQVYLQRLVQNGNVADPASYGVRGELNYILGDRTSLRASAILSSLDLTQVETRLRSSVRLRQLIGTHTLGLEYSYRDRLFNGSLGFQDVQSSFGAVLTSPVTEIGNTGILLSYQAGAQYINADTDRLNLLAANRRNNRVYLGRFQASADVTKGFYLWQGTPLPATPTEGLRYAPTPLVPYLQLITGARLVGSTYTSGDVQQTLTGTVMLQGQFGHFSRSFFDYTAFNLGYSQTLISGLSPFLFDRTVDTRVLSGGVIQQVYGPFRVGFQTAINLDTGKEISTEYILEYARRTYGITLRYNPVQQIGILGLRISDFNWTGGTEPFAGTGVRFVQTGVSQPRD